MGWQALGKQLGETDTRQSGSHRVLEVDERT